MKRLEDVAEGDTLVFADISLSRDDVIAFARDYDPQPFHLDDEAAAATHFKRLAASGWHTASALLSRLADDPVAGLAIAAILEIDDLRWRAPVYPDTPLSIAADVLGVDAVDGRLGHLRLAVRAADPDSKPVATLQCTLAVRRRG